MCLSQEGVRALTERDAKYYGFDPTCQEFLCDPYSVYERMRLGPPLIWCGELSMWLVSQYRCINDLLRDPKFGRVFAERRPVGEWEVFNWLNTDSLLDSEPPSHTRMRRVLAPLFSRSGVRGMEEMVGNACKSLINELDEKITRRGSFDLVKDFAEPLPVHVICELLGIPRSEWAQTREWSLAMLNLYEYARTEFENENGRLGAKNLAGLIAGLVADRRTSTQDDLISHMSVLPNGIESERELIANCVLLFNGGTGATINALGNGITELLSSNEQLSLYLNNPGIFAETAVEEFFRFEAPLQLFERTVLEEVALWGQKLTKGSKIGLLFGSANRDLEYFQKPNSFDISRTRNPHLTFSAGIHFCLGAPLARLEIQTALAMLLDRYPALRLSGEPVPQNTFVVRGYSSIPVTA